MPTSLKKSDFEILQLLKKNARQPVSSIAEALNLSRVTVQKKIKAMEENGQILGYTVKLEQEAFKHKVKGWMTINAEANKEEKAIKKILQLPEVTALYTTNGRWDLAAEITSNSLEEFDRAVSQLRSIDGIETTETNLLLSSRIGE